MEERYNQLHWKFKWMFSIFGNTPHTSLKTKTVIPCEMQIQINKQKKMPWDSLSLPLKLSPLATLPPHSLVTQDPNPFGTYCSWGIWLMWATRNKKKGLRIKNDCIKQSDTRKNHNLLLPLLISFSPLSSMSCTMGRCLKWQKEIKKKKNFMMRWSSPKGKLQNMWLHKATQQLCNLIFSNFCYLKTVFRHHFSQ